MKTFRKSLLAMALGLSMLLTSSGVFAQSAPEPAIVVSVAKIKEQLSDINYLMDAAGYGQMAFLVKVQAEQFLKGIDNDRPAGVMMFFEDDADEPKALAFVPMSNLDDFLTTISEYAEVDEGDDMTTIIPDGGNELFLKEDNGYAYVTDVKELFDAMPSDAEKMLGDLPSRYNFSAKIFGQRVPESLRQEAFDSLREQSEMRLEEMEDDDPIQAELQRQNLELTMQGMESLIKDLDTLEVGFVADAEAESLKFGMKVTSLDGSEFAEQCNTSAEVGPSRFSGFKMADSAFNALTRMKIEPGNTEFYEKSLSDMKETFLKDLEEDEQLTGEDLESAEGILDKMSEVLMATIKEGEVDGGAFLMMSEGEANFASGMHVVDPDRLESAVKDAVELMEKQEGVSDVFDANLNSGSHNGVRMHTFTMTIPDDEEEARDMFGENITVVVGVGKKEVYVAAGSEPMSVLKKAIDSSGSPAELENQFEYNIFLAPILRFAAGVESNEALEMMADKMEEVGKDRTTVAMQMIKNGMTGSVEIKDGVLALIEVAGEAFGAGGGFPGGDDF